MNANQMHSQIYRSIRIPLRVKLKFHGMAEIANYLNSVSSEERYNFSSLFHQFAYTYSQNKHSVMFVVHRIIMIIDLYTTALSHFESCKKIYYLVY